MVLPVLSSKSHFWILPEGNNFLPSSWLNSSRVLLTSPAALPPFPPPPAWLKNHLTAKSTEPKPAVFPSPLWCLPIHLFRSSRPICQSRWAKGLSFQGKIWGHCSSIAIIVVSLPKVFLFPFLEHLEKSQKNSATIIQVMTQHQEMALQKVEKLNSIPTVSVVAPLCPLKTYSSSKGNVERF